MIVLTAAGKTEYIPKKVTSSHLTMLHDPRIKAQTTVGRLTAPDYILRDRLGAIISPLVLKEEGW